MINMHTKFEVSSLSRARGTKNLQVAQLSSNELHHDKQQKFKTTTPLLLVICHPVARIDIDIAYLCIKFDDFRFSCSR